MGFILHKYGPYTELVDTGCTVHMAQFRSCEDCNKIQVKFTLMISKGNACRVSAKSANHALELTKPMDAVELIENNN